MSDVHIAVADTPRAVIRHFTTHSATAAQRAIGFNPTQPQETAIFRDLRAQGLIREASPGLFFVDPEALAAHRTAALDRVLGAATLAGAVIAGAVALIRRRSRKAVTRAR